MKNICADIIVTYNRKKLLMENIAALLAQDFIEHDILIIDNASTDGTCDAVKCFNDDRIKYFNTGKNLGGSGGFAYGMKLALENDYKYAWLMDDDAIPEKNALSSLVCQAKKLNDDFSFLASFVYWINGELHPLNTPRMLWTRKSRISEYKTIKEGLLPIGSCSFVGCFVNVDIARKTYLPFAEFFIYGDDIEYTMRLHKIAPAYLDLNSKIIHKSPTINSADIVIADKERITRFFYQTRNAVYNLKRQSLRGRLHTHKVFVQCVIKIIFMAPNHKFKRLGVFFKGRIAGIFFRPKKIYVEKNVMNDEK